MAVSVEKRTETATVSLMKTLQTEADPRGIIT